MMTSSPVLIVGAGPTGLVLGLWLTKLGVHVRIIDRSAEPGTTSRALAVQVRTLEFYRQIGLADSVIAGGVKVAGANFWVRGSKTARIPFQQIGRGLSPYDFVLVFPQDAHERLLIERLKTMGVHVEHETELIRFREHAAGVQATLRHSNGAEELCDATYLAGCDGASSTVREHLGLGFPGGTYAGLFYVADVEAAGPATDHELHVDIEAADFVLVFPLKGRNRVRLVGMVLRPPTDERPLGFEDVRGRAIAHLGLEVLKVNWFSTYHVHHRVASRFREGRTFLLGDAAHIHSPVGGQGMNTGIADAVNLAWKLAAVLKGNAAGALLDTYEPERIAFARRLVATTDRVFTIVTKQGPVAGFVRTRVVPRLAPLLFRVPPVRRFVFRTVSQIGVNYHTSSLSAGGAGGVRGGDRLPWVRIAAERDNFEPLTSLRWQVHVYGRHESRLSEACGRLRLPLHVFEWQPGMRAAGLRFGALYLIRPDGYVALVDSDADPERLTQYFAERGLTQLSADESPV